jgi:transketolase
VPPEVREDFKAKLGRRGAKLRGDWMSLFAAYQKEHSELAAETLAIQRREPPQGWDKDIPTFPADAKGIASRDSSGKVLNAIAKNHPWLVGGSADLSPSTKTRLTFPDAGEIGRDSFGGRNIHFGVREHAMGAILNGLALAKLRAFGSGFLIFSDYGRGSLRLSAIMEIPVIYIFTHDSIGVGEDGPTHQPVEQLASLRAISLCLGAQEALKKQGVEARVISMPSWKLFEDQDEAYRESVLPSHIRARVSVEQAARFGWERYVGIDGARVGMRTFGESAPLQKLVKKFGFTLDAVVAAAIEQSNTAKG